MEEPPPDGIEDMQGWGYSIDRREQQTVVEAVKYYQPPCKKE